MTGHFARLLEVPVRERGLELAPHAFVLAPDPSERDVAFGRDRDANREDDQDGVHEWPPHHEEPNN